MPATSPALRTVNAIAPLIEHCRDEPLVIDNVRPDLCAELAQIILERMEKERYSTPSLNRGGWKSSETFFSWPYVAVQEIRDAFFSIIGAQVPLVGWAMVNRRGSSHPRHQHAIARLVGVYYVAVGDAIAPTVFECAAHGELEVDPHPGRVVLSPGSMYHWVNSYLGEEPRISVAFDIRR
jgi:hypothetical protein